MKSTKRFFSFVLTFLLLISTFTVTAYADSQWYQKALSSFQSKGTVSNEFDPNKVLTASEFISLAVLSNTYRHGEDTLKVAQELGWVEQGELDLNNNITRGEALRIAIRILNTEIKFDTVAEYAEAAQKLQIIFGYSDGSVKENKTLTYAEAINILANVYEIQATPVGDPVEELPVENFFQNPVSAGFSMSEDGDYLAFAAPYEDRLNVFVQKIDGGEPVRVTSLTDRDIAAYFWKGNNIVYMKDSSGDENYHLYSVDVEGKNDKELTPFEGVLAQPVDLLKNVEDEILILMNQNNPEVFDVYKLNVVTGEIKMVAENPGNISGWLTDNDGKVRIAQISDGIDSVILYRDTEEDNFEVLFESHNGDTLSPALFTKDNKGIYMLTNVDRNTTALVEYSLETKEEKVIYQNEHVDIHGASTNISEDSIGVVTYYTHKQNYVFFDKELEDLYAELLAMLDVESVGITPNKEYTKFILQTATDTNPGVYYYYDSTTDNLIKLADVFPWIDPKDMAEMIPVSYKSRDGLTINGYLTLPKNVRPESLSVIINPHGGPWARDYWGFNQEVQFLANQGYAVLQMNFRGSTGYGKDFLYAGNKQWGKKMQDDITDGVNWLIQQGIADKDKIGIYGASYGGYATLAGITFTPDLYTVAIDYVGVSNLFTFMDSIPAYWEAQRNMLNERVGDPEKDKALFEEVSPVFHADKIKTPLLIAQGANDPRVNKNESDQMVEALKNNGIEVQYIVKDNEGHGFMLQENKIEFYTEMGKFLKLHLKDK